MATFTPSQTIITHLFYVTLLLILGQNVSYARIIKYRNHNTTSQSSTSQMRLIHEQWMAQYGRVYKCPIDKEIGFKTFQQNMERIQHFNHNNNKLYTVRANDFADLTNKEFRATYTGSRPLLLPLNESLPKSRIASFSLDDRTDLAPSVDWRQKGAVTPVKRQGLCGSCWAFATVAAVESANQIKTGSLISLSEQKLLDCVSLSDNGGDDGCAGGSMESSFVFLAKGQRLPTEEEYPYEGHTHNGACKLSVGDSASDQGVAISNFNYLLHSNDFDGLKQALNQQPVAISIDSSGWYFQLYGGGIYNEPLSTNTDHDLLLVGYGRDDNGTDYWLLKNSWGKNWGEDGYMRLLMDENKCPIAHEAYLPII